MIYVMIALIAIVHILMAAVVAIVFMPYVAVEHVDCIELNRIVAYNETTSMFPHRGLTTCSVKENEMADAIVVEVEYRDVVGFPGYRIGNDGTLLTCRKTRAGITDDWRRIPGSWKNGTKNKQYLMVSFRRDGVSHRKLLHHVVLEAFIGPRPSGYDGCHNDDDVTNNSLQNLRWATRQENIRDRDKNGRTAKGEAAGLAKLTEIQVLAIREMASNGIGFLEISELFPVKRSNIGEIVSGHTWKHVGGPRIIRKRINNEAKSQ